MLGSDASNMERAINQGETAKKQKALRRVAGYTRIRRDTTTVADPGRRNLLIGVLASLGLAAGTALGLEALSSPDLPKEIFDGDIDIYTKGAVLRTETSVPVQEKPEDHIEWSKVKTINGKPYNGEDIVSIHYAAIKKGSNPDNYLDQTGTTPWVDLLKVGHEVTTGPITRIVEDNLVLSISRQSSEFVKPRYNATDRPQDQYLRVKGKENGKIVATADKLLGPTRKEIDPNQIGQVTFRKAA